MMNLVALILLLLDVIAAIGRVAAAYIGDGHLDARRGQAGHRRAQTLNSPPVISATRSWSGMRPPVLRLSRSFGPILPDALMLQRSGH
jgi:hypothetical protein